MDSKQRSVMAGDGDDVQPRGYEEPPPGHGRAATKHFFDAAERPVEKDDR